MKKIKDLNNNETTILIHNLILNNSDKLEELFVKYYPSSKEVAKYMVNFFPIKKLKQKRWKLPDKNYFIWLIVFLKANWITKKDFAEEIREKQSLNPKKEE